jgi:hypothetical protein
MMAVMRKEICKCNQNGGGGGGGGGGTIRYLGRVLNSQSNNNNNNNKIIYISLIGLLLINLSFLERPALP